MHPKARELETVELGAIAPSCWWRVCSCFAVLASASCICSGTLAVVFQVCWLSLFSALAVTPPGKASFTGSCKSRAALVGDRKVPDQGPFLGLTAKSRASLASPASRGSRSQGHVLGKAILGSGPAADVMENLSSQQQFLTPCNQKNVLSLLVSQVALCRGSMCSCAPSDLSPHWLLSYLPAMLGSQGRDH